MPMVAITTPITTSSSAHTLIALKLTSSWVEAGLTSTRSSAAADVAEQPGHRRFDERIADAAQQCVDADEVSS